MITTIVTGYDGSPASETAVWWAAAEAVRRSARLRLTYALPLSLMSTPLGIPSVSSPTDMLRETTEHLLAEFAQRIRQSFPRLSIDAVVNFGGAAPALLQEANNAVLVVLGSRGLGEFRDLAMGSVSAHVATHATCPVVVVPPRWEPSRATGGVVVGVDGSTCSVEAIGFAFEQAEASQATLTAVMAWHDPVSTGPNDPLPAVYDLEVLEEESSALLAESMAGHRDRYPEVPVHKRLLRGTAHDVLLAAGRSAELLVVGSRGRGTFRGLLLGSTSRALVHHPPCPVAVVRGLRRTFRPMP
ncbi:universal stress protein [Kribbella sp. NBC_00889]|uniref:universal stress protein n=1 Tax=Kribbella sp. NBC_00889 TaxID=2975974 RepID=UPI00386FC8D6|nr:universal stress protein [Kribbella sp. NBC_00889]